MMRTRILIAQGLKEHQTEILVSLLQTDKKTHNIALSVASWKVSKAEPQ
jgi:hypothetical protein